MNQVYAQITRGFISARGAVGTDRGAGIDFTTVKATTADTVRMIKNSLPAIADGVDRNQGDNTACELTGLVSDFATIPQEGESFEDADGRTYPIESVPYVPGHPLVSFKISNVVTLIT